MSDKESNISLNDLFGNQRDIANIIGVDKYIELTKVYGGDMIYIQKYTEVLKAQRNKEIRSKFNGFNADELAKEYDLTERYIRSLCSDLTARRKATSPDQLNLFEM